MPLMEQRSRLAMLIGRTFVGLSFIVFGLDKLHDVGGVTRYIGTRLPLAPFVFWLAVAIEAGLGFLLISGFLVRPIALFFAMYCLFTTFAFHLPITDGLSLDHFFTNFVMAGGFLYIYAASTVSWTTTEEEKVGLR